MPTSKHIAPENKSAPASKSKSKKKHAPPPPPHDNPHKPGKKHARKSDDKAAAKHLRRAYEHLGRIEALQTITQGDSIATLVRLAQSSIDQDDSRPAADLLRAAEHLSFATFAAQAKSSISISADLEEAIRREFRKLLEHAEEHDLPQSSTLEILLRHTIDEARTAFDNTNFRQALELARAGEALASVRERDADKLDPAEPKAKAGKRALKS